MGGLESREVHFDLMYQGGTKRHTFSEFGNIQRCAILPGPKDYRYKQCAVVVNKVRWEKLRFFVYDERYDHVFQVFETTSNVQQTYDTLCDLLNRQQPEDLFKAWTVLEYPNLMSSIKPRAYRFTKVQSKWPKIKELNLIECGDLIARPIPGVLLPVWHFGVYFDDDSVYHWVSKDSVSNKSKGCFGVTTFRDFMKDETELYVEYSVIPSHGPPSIKEKARAVVRSQREYSLWSQNCEHLAREIVYGQSESRQFREGPSKTCTKCADCKGWNYDGGFDQRGACEACTKTANRRTQPLWP